MNNFEERCEQIRESGALLYEYVRGSFAYGLNIETSDRDTAGVYICGKDRLYGFRHYYEEQVADEKNDNVWYEIGRYIELLSKSNPNMLEGLFISSDMVLYKHPIFDKILARRDEFLTKEAVRSLSGFAISQVKKARGLNKKIVTGITPYKQPLEFCYTFNDKQGTEPISKWLTDRGLKQIYCGLNHLQNMDQAYGVYYDWAQHLHMEYPTIEDLERGFNNISDDEEHLTADELFFYEFERCCCGSQFETIWKQLVRYYNETKPKGYHGIVKEDGTSQSVHLDSILKGDRPICHMLYNKNGFSTNCRKHKEDVEWEHKRNQARYEGNLNHNYDSKNMCHCMRLLTMAVELVKGQGFRVDRRNIDREYLLDVRYHKFEYEDVLAKAESLIAELDELLPTCSLPERVNEEMVNNLLLEIRNELTH